MSCGRSELARFCTASPRVVWLAGYAVVACASARCEWAFAQSSTDDAPAAGASVDVDGTTRPSEVGRPAGTGLGEGARAPAADQAEALRSSPSVASSQGYYYTELTRSWYGWQLLVADAPLLGAFFFSLREGQQTLAYSSLVAHGLVGPVVHGLHRNIGKVAVSGMARLTVGAAFGIAGPWIGRGVDSSASEDRARAAVVLLTSGAVAVVDALWLGYEDQEHIVEITMPSRVIPFAGPLAGGFWLGAGGVF